jgi:hypothetical protein
MTLVDRDNARLVGIGFYASAGHTKEADALGIDEEEPPTTVRRPSRRPTSTRPSVRASPAEPS